MTSAPARTAGRTAIGLMAFAVSTLVACYATRALSQLLVTGDSTSWPLGDWAGVPGAGFAPVAGVGVVAVALGARTDRATAGAAAVGVAVAAAVAHVLAGDPITATLSALVAGAAEALVGGLVAFWWVNRGSRPAALVCAVTTAAVAAVAVSTPLALPGLAAVSPLPPGQLALGWAVSHLVAIVVVAGAVLAPPRWSVSTLDRRSGGQADRPSVELVAQVVILAALLWVAFVATVDLPLAFLPALAVAWSAWRFAPRTSGVEVAVLAVAVAAATARGRGPFGASTDTLAGAVSAHVDVLAVAVLCLLLSAYAQARRLAAAADIKTDIETCIETGIETCIETCIETDSETDSETDVEADVGADADGRAVWATVAGAGTGTGADSFPAPVADPVLAPAPPLHPVLDPVGGRSGGRPAGAPARHDPLTGLPDRDLLTERLGEALVAREHSPARAPDVVALLTCGCDGFASLNDAAGHGIGDQVLAEVAGRLRLAVRASDSVCRLGGDRFAVLCTDMDAAGGAEVVASRVLATVARPIEVDEVVLRLTVSIGMSVAATGTTPGMLLVEAGTAMSAAKRRGGGRFAWYEPGSPASAQSVLVRAP